MIGNDQLVIHDGQLIPREEALALMLKEFPAHGYNEDRIGLILDAAVTDTQNLLRSLASMNPDQAKAELDKALLADKRAAERWRAQWEAEARWATPEYRAQYEAVSKLFDEGNKARERQEKERLEAWKEREKRYQQEQRERRKAEWKAQFDHWQRMNESGGPDAHAAQRARERELEDQEAWRRILKRVSPPLWGRGATLSAVLACLSDHQYIEWMFACAEHGWKAPL